MDRKAFKQRMQELKSYREQNPGKGYLDWKASKLQKKRAQFAINMKKIANKRKKRKK